MVIWRTHPVFITIGVKFEYRYIYIYTYIYIYIFNHVLRILACKVQPILGCSSPSLTLIQGRVPSTSEIGDPFWKHLL